ncbi:hypothetical protein X975_00268, partial [Stegodyphus mimosarum]
MKENINNKTTIYPDCWKGYETQELEEGVYSHMKVNHKYNFVDPKTGAHEQTVQRLWERLNKEIKYNTISQDNNSRPICQNSFGDRSKKQTGGITLIPL